MTQTIIRCGLNFWSTKWQSNCFSCTSSPQQSSCCTKSKREAADLIRNQSVLGSVLFIYRCRNSVQVQSAHPATVLLLRMLSGPRGHTSQSVWCIDIGIDDRPSALRFVFIGTHELHPVDRDVLLLDGLLHAPLVLLEGLGAGVAAPVPLQELLGEPAVEALVVLPLQLGAGLPDAVHVRSKSSRSDREAKSGGLISCSHTNTQLHCATLLEPQTVIGWFETNVERISVTT